MDPIASTKTQRAELLIQDKTYSHEQRGKRNKNDTKASRNNSENYAFISRSFPSSAFSLPALRVSGVGSTLI